MADFYGKSPGIFGSGGGGGGGGTVKANKVALGSGATSGSVVYGTAFDSAPVLVCSVTSSNGSADIITAQCTTSNTTGFDYTLSTQTPDTTYTFNWIASEVADA